MYGRRFFRMRSHIPCKNNNSNMFEFFFVEQQKQKHSFSKDQKTFFVVISICNFSIQHYKTFYQSKSFMSHAHMHSVRACAACVCSCWAVFHIDTFHHSTTHMSSICAHTHTHARTLVSSYSHARTHRQRVTSYMDTVETHQLRCVKIVCLTCNETCRHLTY